MRIALDAMGGDNAPKVTVEGAVQAARVSKHEIFLVGKEALINEELKKFDIKGLSIRVQNADEVVEMDESPAVAVRQKKDSSMAVAARMVADGKADAFVSAGNSGAVMASALLFMGRIKGVSRPAIATLMPSIKGSFLLLDVGANVDCKPKHLLQFALMGNIYMKDVYGVEKPRIGLISIGEEESKGNELTFLSTELIKKTDLNFIGNVEGRDLTRGLTDVAVCDGFVGNIVLKFGEGVAEMLMTLIKSELKAHPMAWFSLPFLWAALKDIRKQIDYAEYGGAPLLGVNGACIIGHGRSNVKAIKNAILRSAQYAEKGVHTEISEVIKSFGDISEND